MKFSLKFKRPNALRAALPELVRRSGWRGLSAQLPQAEQASAEERALWQELAAEVDAPGRYHWLAELLARLGKAWSWPPGTGTLRLTSLATGAVAVGWVLILLAPPGAPPVPNPLIAGGPEPAAGGLGRPLVPDDARTLPAAPWEPAGAAGERAGRGSPVKADGRGASRSKQAGRSTLGQGGGNGSAPDSGRAPKSVAVSPRAVSKGLGPGTAQAPQHLFEDAGLPPEEARGPLDPYALQSGAEGLCAALAALVPVPAGLEGFAVVEVTLGMDGVLVEGEGSARTLVSGGEQVDRFVWRSVRELAAGGPVSGSGRYNVALEAEQRRWSCKEVPEGPAQSAP